MSGLRAALNRTRAVSIVSLLTIAAFAPSFGRTAATGELSNQRITTAIETEFWIDDAVDANDVDVSTEQGVVTFTGIVDSILAKNRAEAVAASTRGVRSVINRIRVEPRVGRADAELREAVKSALFEDPATEAYEIEIEADSGVITLSGTVDSWQEKQLVDFVAKGIAGVRQVLSNVEVAYKSDRSDYEIRQEVEARLKTTYGWTTT